MEVLIEDYCIGIVDIWHWLGEGGGCVIHTSDLVGCTVESQQRGGEVCESTVLTRHNRVCGRVEMIVAR